MWGRGSLFDNPTILARPIVFLVAIRDWNRQFWRLKRTSEHIAEQRDCTGELQQLRDVVGIRAGQNRADRHAAGAYEDAGLGTAACAVRAVGTSFPPPRLSATARNGGSTFFGIELFNMLFDPAVRLLLAATELRATWLCE